MEWTTPLIIVRPSSNGSAIVVNESSSLKDCRYWLNYIAEPFDALHFTPLNSKYTGNGDPQYSCHLISRAKTEYNEDAWRKKVFDSSVTIINFLPPSEDKSKEDKASAAQPATITETDIIQLADGSPRNLSIDQIRAILTFRGKKLNIILAEPTKWIDWESALTLMTKDVHVIGISPDPKWPLTVTLNPNTEKGENMNYANEMKFLVKGQ